MATIAARRPGLSAERRFFFFMGMVIVLTVFAGFAPSYYLRGMVPAGAPLLPMTPLVHLHGLVFSAWVLLFMAQVSLVSVGRPDLHRKLGLAGFLMVVVLIVVGTLAALNGVARASGPPIVPPLSWLAVPLLDVPVFAGMIGAALYFRGTPQVHKRLMLSAMIGMLPPSLGRLPALQGMFGFAGTIIGGMLLFMAALAIWDIRSRGRVHKVTIIATVVLVGSWLFRLAIWQTEPWLAFARWASGFVA